MAAGRRREQRIHAVQQAALVWGVGEVDVPSFIDGGQLGGGGPVNFAAIPGLADKIAEVERTGKLVI